MTKQFFKPWKGDNYNQGFNGKKILILGASFYCNHKEECPFFNECTDELRRDSSQFDACCPFSDNPLSETPSETLSYFFKNNEPPAYRTFTEFMISDMQFGPDAETVWNSVAFTNYVQFELPHMLTNKSNLSPRDYEAFEECVEQLNPDIIIIWGVLVWDAVKAHGYRGCDNPKVDKNYIIIQNIAKRERLLIDCYHPSNMYQQFKNDMPKFKEQLEIALRLR